MQKDSFHRNVTKVIREEPTWLLYDGTVGPQVGRVTGQAMAEK